MNKIENKQLQNIKNVRRRLFEKIHSKYNKTEIANTLTLSDIIFIYYDELNDSIIIKNRYYEKFRLTKQNCIDLKNFFDELSKIC